MSADFPTYHKIKRFGDDENKNIFLIDDDDIVIEEKIDGANFRFYISKEGAIIFGSRTQQLTSNEGSDSNVAKNFRRCVNFVRKTLEGKDLIEFRGLTFYGECCVRHTMNYEWEGMPPYLGFDVGDSRGYWDYAHKKKAFALLGLKMVPLIKIIKASEIKNVTDEDVPISEYALASSQDRQAEGIVFKNYKRQIFAKYVRDAFKEKNSEVFGGTPKYNAFENTNNSEFLFRYVTNPRIEKLIFSLVDEGYDLDMTMMGELIKQTYLDVIEEEWKEILTSNWKLDFKHLRKATAPRVRAVLQQVITNNKLEVFEK